MSFAAIAIIVLFGGWAIAGGLAWVAFSVVTRGNAGLTNLPIAIVIACLFGCLVPLVGFDDGTGLVASYIVAPIAAAAWIGLSRLAFHPTIEPDPQRQPANTAPDA